MVKNQNENENKNKNATGDRTVEQSMDLNKAWNISIHFLQQLRVWFGTTENQLSMCVIIRM